MSGTTVVQTERVVFDKMIHVLCTLEQYKNWGHGPRYRVYVYCAVEWVLLMLEEGGE